MPRIPLHSGAELIRTGCSKGVHSFPNSPPQDGDICVGCRQAMWAAGRMVEAMKTREGDQPLPTASASPSMHDLVCEDMLARKAVGLSRYGRALQAHNGRDGMRDLYEELLDACAYARQLLYERDGR